MQSRLPLLPLLLLQLPRVPPPPLLPSCCPCPPPHPIPLRSLLQVDIGAEYDGLLPLQEEAWEDVGVALAPGTQVQVRVHRVREGPLFRFPIQVHRGAQRGVGACDVGWCR